MPKSLIFGMRLRKSCEMRGRPLLVRPPDKRRPRAISAGSSARLLILSNASYAATGIRHEDRNRHLFQHSLHGHCLAAALDDATTKEIAPTRLASGYLRPRDLGSGPVAIFVGTYRKARGCDDQRVLVMATDKGADLVGSGAGRNERLVSALRKQHRPAAAVCQQSRDNGQFDATVAPILKHV